jgi:hypothetical protein
MTLLWERRKPGCQLPATNGQTFILSIFQALPIRLIGGGW